MTDATRRPRARPMSPHLQVWRWHITMWTSILHRVTGSGLYLGAPDRGGLGGLPGQRPGGL
ncbi:hypothetical protein [Phenylobacterium sp. J367]|uniref:succinate dehydrogenase, cytochrome b556 subunit n=1 Tax=Phenylobacterium sp. J367 TaxID=2898435 RepID=UPI002151A1C2|nr:hypothetical protein [Phenylobacterium sp. J367]